MRYVDVAEAQSVFLQLTEEVIKGEEVIFTREGQPIAKLTRVEKSERRWESGSAKGLITMREDFDDPIEDFKDAL